ncbi:MAG: hypothetical protein JSV27_07070, partial [Candidatus Bathyarchaeota archaeon]
FGGGGGGTSYDLEMARLNAETNWRAMQMNMQAQQMRLEQQGEIDKYEQLGSYRCYRCCRCRSWHSTGGQQLCSGTGQVSR